MRLPVTIRCLIIQNENIILCYNKAGGYYFFPGGGLETGETIDECITRELIEEMGVSNKEIKIYDDIIFTYENSFKDSENNNFYEINILKKVNVNHSNIQSQEELIDFKYFKIEDIKNITLYPIAIKNWVIEYLKNRS